MLAGFGRAFSQVAAITVSASALLLTLALRRRRLRYFQIIGAHGLCLLLACLAVVYDLEQPSQPFYQAVWLGNFLQAAKTPGHWLQLVASLFWALLFWGAGVRSVLVARTHTTISNHFDLGVIALLLLYLLEWLLLQEGGIVLTGLSLPRLLFAFLAFTVLAFCLGRCRGVGESDFLVGFRGIGAVLGFLSMTLLLGAATVAFFLPALAVMAESGVAVMGSITAPVAGFFLRLLVFFFGRAKLRQEQGNGPPLGESLPPDVVQEPVDGWLLLVQEVLLVVSAGLMVVLLLALLVFLCRQLVWWLNKRWGKIDTQPSPWQGLWPLMQKIFAALSRLSKRGARRKSRPVDGVHLYLALTVWGRRSGLPPAAAETPRCYGQRLCRSFPRMTREISAVVGMHNDTLYARQPPSTGQLQEARTALRRLRSLRLWPSRLKGLYLPPFTDK